MIVSAKGRYALRVMIVLANNGNKYASLKDIAKDEKIPHKFLENIMTELAKAGLVESSRGKSGGYRLSRKPEDYTVAEILKVTEISFASVGCSETGNAGSGCSETDESGCTRAGICPTLPMWKALDETVNTFFGQYTLKSFLTKDE